jgi:hypothetical protein
LEEDTQTADEDLQSFQRGRSRAATQTPPTPLIRLTVYT